MEKNNIHRIIDANFNRLKEGLRVIEEIARFLIGDKNLTDKIKELRHMVTDEYKKISYRDMMHARESDNDVGKIKSHDSELKRDNIKDILLVNFKRCQEAARVLEEFTKLIQIETALNFKKIRFDIYSLEKKMSFFDN